MSIAYGQPSNISQVPTPAATVNIASSTNASPTVITTSTAHGLQTGMAIIINGHLVNTAVNGIWIATVLTSTTFKISTFSGFPGTFVNGVGVGVATGTVQSLAFPGITIPEDAVTDIDAASVNVGLEGLADMTAWLAYKVLSNMTILAGGSMIFSSGASAATGLTLGALVNAVFNGSLLAAGAFTSSAAASFTGGAAFNSLASFNAGVAWRAPYRPTTAALINVAQTDGDIVILPDNTAGSPPDNVDIADGTEKRQIMIVLPDLGAEGYYYDVRRADATIIAKLRVGNIDWSATPQRVGSWVLLQVEGGVWRGMASSGPIEQGAGW